MRREQTKGILSLKTTFVWCRMSDGGRPPEVCMQMRASNRPDAAVVQKITVVSDLGKGAPESVR